MQFRRTRGCLRQHPIEFAVLSMNSGMSHGQWLHVTLTGGVGVHFLVNAQRF